MKTAPIGFTTSLTNLDPLLSVRWGETIGQWVIERKAVIPDSELQFLVRREARLRRNIATPLASTKPSTLANMKKTWVGVSEELVAARTGKRVILFSHHLTAALYDALVAGDITRYGGYARFADAMDRADERKEADVDRQLENQRHAYNQEVWGMLDHIWRKKESGLLQGERDMRYLLHGKHTREDSEPLIKITDF